MKAFVVRMERRELLLLFSMLKVDTHSLGGNQGY